MRFGTDLKTWNKSEIKRLEEGRQLIKKQADLLKSDGTDVYLSELICQEEINAIAELIDSIIEKEILRNELSLARKDLRDRECET